MLISTERLYYEGESTEFRPEILEKVIYLIHLLNRFSEDPFLKDRFVLKGVLRPMYFVLIIQDYKHYGVITYAV